MTKQLTTRRYVVVAMSCDPSLPPPWHADVWNIARAELDAIFTERKPAVRAFVHEADTKTRGWAKLGRLAWNGASHDKWLQREESDGRRFARADFAAPSLAAFDKSGVPPNVYANLFGHRERFAIVDGQWDTSKVVVEPGGFFVAVAVDDAKCSRVEELTIAIGRKWRAKTIGRKERTWAAAYGADGKTMVDPSMLQASLRPNLDLGWVIVG